MNTTMNKPIFFNFKTQAEAEAFAVQEAARDYRDANNIRVIEVSASHWQVATMGDTRYYYTKF